MEKKKKRRENLSVFLYFSFHFNFFLYFFLFSSYCFHSVSFLLLYSLLLLNTNILKPKSNRVINNFALTTSIFAKFLKNQKILGRHLNSVSLGQFYLQPLFSSSGAASLYQLLTLDADIFVQSL